MINLIVHLKRKVDSLVNDYKVSRMAFKWRRLNRHNKTFAAGFFPIDRVTVGKHSYGMLNVSTFCDCADEKLIIGNYVSIADKVTFILGGEHQINMYTTFPLRAYFTRINNNKDSMSKGPIIIEDEVWLGYGAIILSGVRIGRGAIVGAGSVVTRNIPPYSIVAGNPARIIRYRFSETVIEKICGISLSEIPEKNIIGNLDIFNEPVEDNDKLIEKLKKLGSRESENPDGVD
jgi:virginiamycin A acetyltransferase